MIQKKVCMLGTSAVGKTSLVSQYVKSIFSDKYLTSVGVKIDKKELSIDQQAVKLMLWDIAGEDDFTQIKPAYLRGAAAYFLVIDGTRRETLNAVFEIHEKVVANIGEVPHILLFNKADLKQEWAIQQEDIDGLVEKGFVCLSTSAKTGENVELAFEKLARLAMSS